ncbi:MAG: hypothetical protein R6U98_18210 [Pirellulaceae bacterium]
MRKKPGRFFAADDTEWENLHRPLNLPPQGLLKPHLHVRIDEQRAAPIHDTTTTEDFKLPQRQGSRLVHSAALTHIFTVGFAELILQAVGFVQVERWSTQAALALVGFATDNVVRDRYVWFGGTSK